MRKKLYATFLIIIMLLLGITAQSQPKVEISPYAGWGIPIGKFGDVSKPGLGYGLSADYFFIPNLGFGLNAYSQAGSFKSLHDLSLIPPSSNNSYQLLTSEKGNWSTLFFGAGPVYRAGSEKFNVDIFSKAGYTLLKSPDVNSTFIYGDHNKPIASVGNIQNAFGLLSGMRLNIGLSSTISLFLGVQHLYSGAKFDYTTVDISKAYYTDAAGVSRFEPGLLVEQPERVQQISPSYINTNIGINIKLGGKKKSHTATKPLVESPSINQVGDNISDLSDFFEPELDFPLNKTTFDVERNNRPDFTWSPGSEPVKDYTFVLLKDGKEVYREKTKKASLAHNAELEKIYATTPENASTNYAWKVISNLTDARQIPSETNNFKMQRSSGAFHDVHDIECDEPAYNSDGSVNYTAQITFFNNISATHPLIISSASDINLTSPSGALITGLTTCSPPHSPVTFPITVAPGGSQTICFKFTVASGTNNIISNVNGTISGLPQVSNAQDSIKSCICTVCDTWRLRVRGNRATQIDNKFANMQLSGTLTLMNANPIIEVKAEVVSIKQTVSDTACYTCTKHDDNMGLIRSGKITPANNWGNAGNGALFDDNNDGYGNELTWTSSSGAGVNFGIPKNILINLNLPEFNNLECCKTTYHICVRYTFTDVDCNSCDYLVCYRYGPITVNPGGTLPAEPALPRGK